MKKKENSKTLKRILLSIRQYKLGVGASLILAFITVALTLYVPILIGQGVDLIIAPGKVDFSGLSAILGKILAAVAVTALSQWMMNHINNRITYRVVMDIRTQAFNRLEVLPISYLDTHSSGDIISRVITDIDQFSEGLLMGFTQLFTGVMTILGTLLFMLSINPLITIVVVVLTPLSLVVASFIAKKTYTMFHHQSETRGQLTGLVDEMLGNLKVVQAFGRGEEIQKDFEEINNRLAGYSLKATFFSSITNPATRFVNSIVYAAVGLAGSYAAIRGLISVGQLTSFLSYANQYTKPFNEISGVVTELQNALASAARVFALIDEEALPEDKPDALDLKQATGKVDLCYVDFSYNPENKLIENLNLQVEPGQRVAIVGPTGCGKTTVINLLMRFYDVNDGAILIDGHNVKDFNRSELRQMFGMVLQDTWLFHGSIRDNIKYGKLDATDEEVIQAAKAARVHRFVQTLPGGYDMELNEEATNVSQGQKQLLTIARAILVDPKILILDEATSSVDTRTEIQIQKAMDTLMKGRTSFVIAHRLSTIRDADIILVMKDGDIIEQGSHDELIAQNGFYAELYNSQFEKATSCA